MDEAPISNVIRYTTRWKPAAWMEGYTKIALKGGAIHSPTVNVHQSKMDEIVRWAHEHKRPVRLVALKPRQKGSSTGSVAIGTCRLKARRARGLIAGGKHFQGENLFAMLETFSKHDRLDPDFVKVMDMKARYKNGSMMQRITLSSGDAGRSGTYQFLLVTEAAYLADEGVANADKTIDGLVKCVAFEPDTIIIIESTANGASGYFHDLYTKGITFEEFKAGRNGYIQVFSAWFEFEDSYVDPKSEGIESEDDYTQAEAEYAEKWDLCMGQVAWMRMAIRDECRGDFDKFQQDYPSDPQTAFLNSGRCAFDAEGLDYQETLLPIRRREFGVLAYSEKADRVIFTPTDEKQATCVRMEPPREGCTYVMGIDTMTGEDQTGGQNPDSHSVFVLRDGYEDEYGRWFEPAVAARNMLVPGIAPDSLCCWWNIDVLCEFVWRLSRYYGGCLIAPEMNMDRGLVELLKLRDGISIYQREIFNHRQSKKTEALGWMTTPQTRPGILENLIAAVREAGKGEVGKGIEFRCPWILDQAKNFGTKLSGRMEALKGKDDDILALAIAYQLRRLGTPYFEPRRESVLPHHLRQREENIRRGRDSTYA